MTGISQAGFTNPWYLFCTRNTSSFLHKSQAKLNGVPFVPRAYEHRAKFSAENLTTCVQLLMLKVCICFQETGACGTNHR